jgi:hypothetical protein
LTDAASIAAPAKDDHGGWLYRHVPRPRLGASANGSTRPRRVLVFTKGENASFDYYLSARLQALGLPHETCCIDRGRFHDIDTDGLLVIICRYVRPRHVAWIARNRRSLAGVAYFVDDDIPALVADRRNDPGYRLYLAHFACLPMMRLNRDGLLTHLWVSTAALAGALDPCSGSAALLAPAPLVADHLPLDRQRPRPALKIVYHATGSHCREHEFLVPVMEEVLRQRPQVRFEVLASGMAGKLWSQASIAGGHISIVAPMAWRPYYRHSREEGADIALMPLLDGLANNSRADTKLIDCCRLGAAAVLSDAAPYRHHRGSGCVMAGNSPRQWIGALLDLIDHADRREAAKQSVRRRVAGMALRGEPFPGVCRPREVEAAP